MAKALNVSLAVTADTGQAKAELQSLQNQLTNLVSTAGNINLTAGLNTSELSKAVQMTAELSQHLKNATNINTGTLNFTEFSKSLTNSGKSITDYGRQLLQLGPQGQQAFTQLATAISKSDVPLARANTLLGQFWTTLKNTARWQISSSMLHGFMGALQGAYSYAQDLNRSLNDIQIVTQASDEHMAKFAEQANKSAKALSTTTTAYTKASLIYYQQGLNDQQVKERTDVTVKMANVTGQSAQQVSDQLTAIWNNFAEGSGNLEYYADVITALGAATASSSEEISRGLSKFAAIADTVGLSYENATAALATITATTRQSADTVGTGLRTLFSRLQSLSLGETLEDGVNLTKYSKALETVGVSVLDLQGNLRSMDDILEDLGNRWDKIGDSQKVALAQTVGGVRQYTTLMALMDNFDFYKQNQNIAKNSEGTLEKQQEVFEKSWLAAQKRMKAAGESLITDVFNDKAFIGFTDFITGILNLLDKVIDKVGGLKPIIFAIGSYLTKMHASKVTEMFTNGIYNIMSMTKVGQEAINKDRQTQLSNLINMSKEEGFGDPVGKARAHNLEIEVGLQQELLANANSLSEKEQSIAQMRLDGIRAANEAYAQMVAQSTKQQEALRNARNSFYQNVAAEGTRAGTRQTIGTSNLAYDQSYISLMGKGDKFGMAGYLGGIEALRTEMQGLDGESTMTANAFNTILNAINQLNAGVENTAMGPISNFNKAIADLQARLNDPANPIKATEVAEAIDKAINELNAAMGRAKGRLEAKTGVNPNSMVNEGVGAGTAVLKKYLSGLSRDQLAALGIMPRPEDNQPKKDDKSLSGKVSGMAKGLGDASQAMMNIGMAVSASTNMWGTWADSGKSAGDKIVASLTGIPMVLGAIASGLKLVQTASTAAQAAMGWIAIIGSILGFVIAGIQTLKPETDEERLERLNEEASTLNSELENAKSAYNNILTAKTERNDALEQLNKLTKGTLEWRDALLQVNAISKEIIDLGGLEYGKDKDWYIDENGVYQISAEGIEKALDRNLKRQETLQRASLATNALNEAAQEAPEYRESEAQVRADNSQFISIALGESRYNYLTAGYRDYQQNINPSGSFRDYREWIVANQGHLSETHTRAETAMNQLNASDAFYSLGIWDHTKDDNGFYSTEEGYEEAMNGWNEFYNWMMNARDKYNHDMNPVTSGNFPINNNLQELLVQTANEDGKVDIIDSIAINSILANQGSDTYFKTLESDIDDQLEDLSVDELTSLYKELFDTDIIPENIKNKPEELRREIKAIQIANHYAEQFELKRQEFANTDNETIQAILKSYDNIENETLAEASARMANYNPEAEGAPVMAALNDTMISQWANSLGNLHVAMGSLTGTESMVQNWVSENNLTRNQTDLVTKYLNRFNKLFGESTRNAIKDNIVKNGAFNEELNSILSGIDFSSSLSSILDLHKAIKKNGGNKELLNIYNAAFKDLGGNAGLLEELYKSDEFSESLEDLQKTFKTTGKLAASDILEAAKSNEILNDYLEMSSVNAAALADILTMVGEDGSLSIDQVSNALLDALSAAGALESGLAQTFSFIDNFSLSRSAQDIGDFYSDLVDTIETGIGKGNVGDAQIYEAYSQIFGKDAAKQLRQSFSEYSELAPGERNKAFQSDYAQEIAVMKSIQERGDLSGLWGYYQEHGAFADNGITWDSATYDLAANGDNTNGWENFQNDQGQQIKTSDDYRAYVAQEIATAMGYDSVDQVDSQLVESLVQDQLRENVQLQDYLKTNDAQEGLSELISSATEQGIINEEEINAFLNEYADYLDEDSNTLEEITSQIEQQSDGKAHVLKDASKYFKDGEATLQGFEQQLKDSGYDSKEDYFKAQGLQSRSFYMRNTQTGERTSENYDTYDLNEYIAAMEKAGYTADQALSIASESGQHFTSTMSDAFGNSYEFIQRADESLEEFQNRMQSEINTANVTAEAEIYATAMKDAFSTIEFQGDFSQMQAEVADLLQPKTIVIDGNASLAQQAIDSLTRTITVTINGKIGEVAKYGGIVSSYSSGSKNRKLKPGPALTGEEKPEIVWNPDLGYAYIVGQNGPEFTTLHPGDRVFNGEETEKILANSSANSYLYGSYDSGGYGTEYTFGGKGGGSNATANNAKTSKYDPERYHLITRQLKDLQREYDRLNKIKENCYGTNKLEAIQREIDATDQLIKGQKALIREAEDYLKIDADRLKKLLGAGEFQIDENGNLLNFEELQEKYRKKAEEDKDEHAQDIWKALQQYEETLDKLQDANVEMQNLLYQEMELRLEKITTKVDMRIDFDDREIKLLDHYIKRIDDNIYHTAEVLALTEEKLGHISKKIDDTTEGIHELFAEMSDSEGNLITKADGTAYTLDEWLALTNAERDMLDINGQFGEQLEEYMDDLLDYIEELEEFKTKGVEEFADAFSELNDNVRSSIDLFDHYNQLLSSLKNITDLQGIKLTAELKAARKEIDQIMFQNTQNNIQAEGDNYKRLVSEVENLRRKIANTQDETLKKAWEEQLKVAEEELRTSQQNMLTLWETGLEQAKDMFEQALQDAVDTYETTIAGMYGTVDELEKAWDQQKKNDDFYVKDFEKYYQIQKLQRSITKDLDAAARTGNKQNQGLKKLYEDLNAARESGVELSAYDLDIYAKRYEYEKALMELEDARNNKNEVRLQRDANGNWGYVYTSAADEDDLIAKQQAVDDKFYELQKATQERIASLSDDLMSEITGVGKRLQELHSSGASQDTIKKYLEQEKLYLENYEKGLAKALEDAGMTEEEARNRYGNAGFDILNDFQETLFSAITGGDEGLDEFFKRVSDATTTANGQMVQAGAEYQKQVSTIDKWFNESGEDLATVIKGFAALIGEESSGTLLDSKEQIDNAKQTFTDILQVARDFEQEFMTIYQPIIDANEALVEDLLTALHALNEEEYEGPDHSSNPDTNIGDIIGDTGSSSEGGSGSGGSGSGSSSGYTGWGAWQSNNSATHHRYYYTNGVKGKEEIENHTWQVDAGDHFEGPRHYHSETCTKCKQHRHWYTYLWGSQDYTGMATGGYTGEWGQEGRLAMLHEKELVLNKDDTENFLNATTILRTLDLQTGLFSKGLGSIITPLITNMQQGVLDQNVHIDATFPNVTDHSEIEAAFDNLINKASQYANRKNMSAMTFNDMYISKF